MGRRGRKPRVTDEVLLARCLELGVDKFKLTDRKNDGSRHKIWQQIADEFGYDRLDGGMAVQSRYRKLRGGTSPDLSFRAFREKMRQYVPH